MLCRHRYTTRRERRPLPAASACQKERVVSTSRDAHGGHVVIDHSPQSGSGEWWRVTFAVSQSLNRALTLPVIKGYRPLFRQPLFRQSQSRPRVVLGRFVIWDRQGQSGRFRCVGITVVEIYDNTTSSRRNSSYDQRRRGPKKYPS